MERFYSRPQMLVVTADFPMQIYLWYAQVDSCQSGVWCTAWSLWFHTSFNLGGYLIQGVGVKCSDRDKKGYSQKYLEEIRE